MRLIAIQFCLFLFNYTSGQKATNFDSLTNILENVYNTDQVPRLALDSLEKKYGFNAPEIQQVIVEMVKQDSLNKKIVTAIIDTYGWLGAKETSEKANTALFLVIQHVDLSTQLKYLPELKKAVQKGNAKASHYAYLVDRTNLKQGKFQIYGSQMSYDKDGNMYFDPIIDEPNVNLRRKAVGLPPLEELAKEVGMKYVKPKLDSLKNKIVLIIRLYENQRPLNSVAIFLGNNKQIGKTNESGFFQMAIDKSFLHWALIFRKEGYHSYAYVLDDTNKEIFEINIALRKN